MGGGKKSSTISAIRFISMLLIVTCHIFQYYDNPLCRWLNVGVQIFFIISGFLYASKTIYDPIDFFKKQIRKILPSYYVFLVFAIIMYVVFCRDILTVSTVIKSLFCVGTIKGLGHLWFVGYILFCYFLTPYLCSFRDSIKEKKMLTKIVYYIGLILFVQVIGFLLSSYFLPDRIACYIIGFVLADLYRTLTRLESVIMDGILILIGIVLNVIRGYMEYNGIEISQTLVNAYVRYAHLFLGLSIFLILKIILANIKYNYLYNWSDKYSYHFYIVHLLFILSPFTLMNVTGFAPINCVLAVFASLISSVILLQVTSIVAKK